MGCVIEWIVCEGADDCSVWCRFLADMMDNPLLIRNVVLCGHIHHGKVRCSLTLTAYCVLVYSHGA